jgi:hypothetical protein
MTRSRVVEEVAVGSEVEVAECELEAFTAAECELVPVVSGEVACTPAA